VELEKLEQRGFGKFLVVGEKHLRREMFMKPSPTTISPDDVQLMDVKLTLEEYTSRFVGRKNEDISNHYQFEEICDMFN
jgi:hypothetical protein